MWPVVAAVQQALENRAMSPNKQPQIELVTHRFVPGLRCMLFSAYKCIDKLLGVSLGDSCRPLSQERINMQVGSLDPRPLEPPPRAWQEARLQGSAVCDL